MLRIIRSTASWRPVDLLQPMHPMKLRELRFALAWLVPAGVATGIAFGPWWALAAMAGVQLVVALTERLPGADRGPAPVPQTRWHSVVLRLHVVWQLALLGGGLLAALQAQVGWAGALVLGVAVGGVCGSQGITFAHELGHSRQRVDRALAWLLMASVNYAHFMVEHYRGHHVRAATFDDPASARRGESLWRFLPRTLAGSWRSAWALEKRQLLQFGRGWQRSPLLWATVAQAVVWAALALFAGPKALLFWAAASAYAVFLLEAINYIEHYGLARRTEAGGRAEPFGMQHAWNADHALTNALIANLQRHSDHHMHAWKPYAELAALPGPQLPTGYAGCIALATVPRLWFGAMHKRLDALAAPA
jgi:alkane 1-monooxygenase